MNGFLIDTNVISELVKVKPSVKVTEWIDSIEEELLYLSVLTLGEIREGIVQLPQSRRRTRLEAWLSGSLLDRFAGRVLAVDVEVADRWGSLLGARAVPAIDGLLAATAIQHDLTLVTRNTKDVEGTGAAVFNPWVG